jgi:hypothetical protein
MAEKIKAKTTTPNDEAEAPPPPLHAPAPENVYTTEKRAKEDQLRRDNRLYTKTGRGTIGGQQKEDKK